MGVMTGSGECWTGDCPHSDHPTDQQKIDGLAQLLKEAMEADPSKFVNGHLWHDQVKKALGLER
jgi:hypothetical protein